jgi:hypothetical protein
MISPSLSPPSSPPIGLFPKPSAESAHYLFSSFNFTGQVFLQIIVGIQFCGGKLLGRTKKNVNFFVNFF